MSNTPAFCHTSISPPDRNRDRATTRSPADRTELLTFLEQAMAYLFPVISEDVPEHATSRQFSQTNPRHPSRYRVTFTVARLPIQSLFFDEMPNMNQSPPRPRELCMSMALDHHSDCPFPQAARTRVTSHIATLGATAPVTSCLLKVCPHCIALLPDIDPQYPNDSYAEFGPLVPPAWTPIRVIDRPEYHTLPPVPCALEHNLVCAHRHCPDPLQCTCNTATPDTANPTTVINCSHTHCTTPQACTCTTACPEPSDHIMSDVIPHRNCIVAHCDNPAAHLSPGGQLPPPETRPDPTTVVPPEPVYSTHRIMLTSWMSQMIEMFTTSTHAASYATSCANVVPHLRHYEQTLRASAPAYNPEAMFFRSDFPPNQAFILPMYMLHPTSTLADSNQHATHTCPLIVCPLTMLHELQTGTRSINTVSITTFLKLYRASVTIALT
jgi:hypothetical protein